MSIVRCSRGHFFDDEKYDSCPNCAGSGGPRWQMEEEKTVSLDAFGGGEIKRIHLTAQEPAKQSVRGNWDSEKTVALSGYEREQLIAGWLVCICGEMRGRDYRLYSGFNRIGREISSDICIQDAEVSKETHCSVVYDDKSGIFYLVPGKGTLTYLNEEIVQEAVKLQEGDRIRIGSSTFELAAFCKGEHTWKTM